MAHAERCPVCGGSGKKYRYNKSYESQSTIFQPMYIEDGICNGCPNGQGWITVQDTDSLCPSVFNEELAEKLLPIALETWPPYPDYTRIYYD